MKTIGIVAGVLLCSLLLASNEHLSSRFRTVYILPMSDSLDQHLASRLAAGSILWVVLDPSSADVVLTDSVDTAFWVWMQRTYPVTGLTSSDDRGSTVGTRPDVPPPGGRRGTVFLVDPRKRVVLWSTYAMPKNGSSPELDRAATRVAGQLKGAFGKR